MSNRFFFLILSSLFAISVFGQTFYYERIKIVSNGKQKACKDDAHYLTFNGNKCYESDATGMAVYPNLYFDFNRKENDILYYSGDCILGKGCDFFVTSSKDRINLKKGEDIYVYVKTTPQASNAKKREVKKSNYYPIIPPIKPISPDPTPSPSDNRRYPGKRQCPGCRGSGKGSEIIEDVISYTVENKYCKICDEWRHPHIHRIPMCKVCYGKGYVE